MNNNIIDSRNLDNVLNNLDDEQLKNKIIYQALIKGAKCLQDTTKQYFKQTMGDAANHVSKWTHKPFVENIVLKGDKAYTEVRVSIMKDFRLKFFEKGTNERVTKKGHKRGKINGKWFFKDARINSVDQVNNIITETIDNGIKKILR